MSKKINIVICIIAVLVVGCGIFLLSERETEFIEKYDDQLQILKNNNEFYTVSNCVTKLMNYYKQKNTDAVLSILSRNYKEKNHINASNVLNTFDIDENTGFSVQKVLVQYISESEYKYYIHTTQWKIKMNINTDGTKTDIKDVYYLIYMKDTDKETIFSIEPYNGNEFKDVIQ